jgi:hypothetical protein
LVGGSAPSGRHCLGRACGQPSHGQRSQGRGRASHVKGTSSTRHPGVVGEDLGDAAMKSGGARAGGGRPSIGMVVASLGLCCRRPWEAAAGDLLDHLPELPPPATSVTSCCRSPLCTAAAGHHSVPLLPATSPTSFSH